LRHLASRLPISVTAVTAVTIAAATAVLAAFGDVREQRKLSRPLHRARYLALMATARSGDATRADLATVGDEPTQH
jgi:hypothetical protein